MPAFAGACTRRRRASVRPCFRARRSGLGGSAREGRRADAGAARDAERAAKRERAMTRGPAAAPPAIRRASRITFDPRRVRERRRPNT
ncbi:hypothetical protein F5D26_19390 [Burkholderia pseudomallei]|nr:hypothetical protein F5D26_19390 [Burkholderia pseudomallei]